MSRNTWPQSMANIKWPSQPWLLNPCGCLLRNPAGYLVLRTSWSLSWLSPWSMNLVSIPTVWWEMSISGEMVGLVTLHKCVAIYCRQVNNVSSCYCPFCNYVGSHHIAINNHICSHWHLGLLCSYPGCFQAHMEADAMLAHMLEKHGMSPYGRN